SARPPRLPPPRAGNAAGPRPKGPPARPPPRPGPPRHNLEAGHRAPLRHHQHRARHRGDLPVVGTWRTDPARVILIRDTTTTGYDLALVTTDLTSPAEQIIALRRPLVDRGHLTSTPRTCSASAKPATASKRPWNAPSP